MPVTYQGINDLVLTIPLDAQPIPLSYYTDFAGLTIEVHNNSKNTFLFQLTQQLYSITLSGAVIDMADFRSIPELYREDCLLIIEDQKPWVENRIGYNYGMIRKDAMFIHHGKGQINVVQSYREPSSEPLCSFCPITNDSVVFKNLFFVRSKESTSITCLLRIENQTNVYVSNINISTPEANDKYGDAAIVVRNVVGLCLSSVTIKGTYSQRNKYGYGISLNNITNFNSR